MQPIKIDN